MKFIKANAGIICFIVLVTIIIIPLLFLLKSSKDKYEVEKTRKKEMMTQDQRANEINGAARKTEDIIYNLLRNKRGKYEVEKTRQKEMMNKNQLPIVHEVARKREKEDNGFEEIELSDIDEVEKRK